MQSNINKNKIQNNKTYFYRCYKMLTETQERTKSHQETSIVRMALETELAFVISIR